MIILRRGQVGKELGLDITVKSSSGFGRMFAPTWNMVLGLKKEKGDTRWPNIKPITQAQYVEMYVDILDNISPEFWERLQIIGQQVGEITFLCYCKDGDFCHTYLLRDYMINRWPDIYSKKQLDLNL